MVKNFFWGGVIAMSAVMSAAELPPAVELEKLARKDAMNPIAPGKNGGAPFWNIHARRFIYVPSFDFTGFPKAKGYRFTVFDAGNKVHTFTTEHPDDPLTPVWDTLPVGFTTVSVEALDAKGNVVANSGVRKFYRAAPFRGNYAPALRGYRESAQWALKYIFEQPHIQAWRKTGQPSRDYDLYCYPSKIIGSLVRGMITYAKLNPKDREAALDIAVKAADYLISISDPAGAPLEYMPPTYMWDVRTSKKYANQNMMIYPAFVGNVYMLLYRETKNRKYREAARRIAETYCRLQQPNGSWHLKIHQKTGAPVMGTNAEGEINAKPNYCMPGEIADFLSAMADEFNEEKYRTAAKRAMDYVCKTVLPTFNWEGQFEDVTPRSAYVDNTFHTAASFAQYLLRQKKCSKKDMDTARTLLRYAEDQFVVWEKPMPFYPASKSHSSLWRTPGALEQYLCYMPIDSSAAVMLNFYVAMHKKSKSPLDLAKAKALADAVTRAQDQKTGRYMTYWENNEYGKMPGWINCAMTTAYAMMNFNDYLDSLTASSK